MLQNYPGRYDLLFALLGAVLGPVMIWEGAKALREREGDFDRQLAPWMSFSAVAAIVAGIAMLGYAGYWLITWLPQYLPWY